MVYLTTTEYLLFVALMMSGIIVVGSMTGATIAYIIYKAKIAKKG